MAKNYKKILFIRLSAVGDVINAIPALESIRAGFPDSFIGFLVEDRAHDLVQGHPSVDRVHLFPRKRWVKSALRPRQWRSTAAELRALVSEIRREGYEVALDFQGNLKGGVCGLLSGAPDRVGFARGSCRELNFLFTNLHVTPPRQAVHFADKFLSLSSWLGAPREAARYRLPESPESRARVQAFLSGERLSNFVVIHPGTSDFGRAKRWLPERFSALARRLGIERGLRSVIAWGPGERPLAERIAAESACQAAVAFETRSVLDLAELIGRARLFIGCDSGPMHLASVVNTPTVALFGPKDPEVYGPRNPRRRIVLKVQKNGRGSMAEIRVEDVYRAAVDLLAETEASEPAKLP